MASILVYSEASALAQELLTAARIMARKGNLEVKILVVNDDNMGVEMARRGAAVYQISKDCLKKADVASMTEVIALVAKRLDVSIVLLAANHKGKELADRLARLNHTFCLSDVNCIKVAWKLMKRNLNTSGIKTVYSEHIRTGQHVIAVTPGSYIAPPINHNGCIQDLMI
ncbi:MAG: hypothetical protein ABRQ24_03080 [Syntrophomonadaceae bacterium]